MSIRDCPPAPFASDRRDLVIAFHCTGSSGRQWSTLGERLGQKLRFVAPDLGGTATGHAATGRRFSLADEAAPYLHLIDSADAGVHLVGHSYGGALALHLASRRPNRIASLSLYEPSAIHLLEQLGRPGLDALMEFDELIGRMRSSMHLAPEAAAALFVDFWNGAGSWAAMKPEARLRMIGYLPKLVHEAPALMRETATIEDYGRIGCPILVLSGERSPACARLITNHLARRIAAATLITVKEAAHMGPVTHRDFFAETVARRIEAGVAVPDWRRFGPYITAMAS